MSKRNNRKGIKRMDQDTRENLNEFLFTVVFGTVEIIAIAAAIAKHIGEI